MLLEVSIAIAAITGYKILTKDKKPKKVKLCGHSELTSLKGNGVRISNNIRLSPHFSNEHALVLAPSGMRKTRGIIMPSVKEIDDSTLIVTDPSGEIAKECKKDNTIIFNPYSDNSIGYDPLKNCRTVTEVKKVAQVIMANGSSTRQNQANNSDHQEWLNKAIPLLTAYMLWNWKMERYSFDELMTRITTAKMMDIHTEIMNSNVEEAKIEFLSFVQVAGASQTLSCIRNTLNTAIQLFLDPSVKRIFSRPSIKLDTLRDKPVTLYIQIPERDSEYFTPLTATFISQMLDRLLEKEDGVQTYMLLDELCNIGYIPNLCTLLSTARKRKVSITGAIQSLSQLERVYGDVQAKELRELFKTLVIMGGLKDSAEYISSLLGNEEVYKNNQRYFKPVLSADEIRRLPTDKCLVLCHNRQPVIDDVYIM